MGDEATILNASEHVARALLAVSDGGDVTKLLRVADRALNTLYGKAHTLRLSLLVERARAERGQDVTDALDAIGQSVVDMIGD